MFSVCPIYPFHTHLMPTQFLIILQASPSSGSSERILRSSRLISEVYVGEPFERNICLPFENSGTNGEVSQQRMSKEIDENTELYTHRAPHGLFYSTQFAQPALTLMAKVSFPALEARSLIPDGSTFAGHSSGEYAALSALSNACVSKTSSPWSSIEA